MKKLLLLFILCLQFISTRAQFVTISDATFLTWLTQNYPTCMNGNQMDTTCALIVNEDSLIIQGNINSIVGVEYFDNLNFLYCGYNNLTSLPQLADNLTYLNCSGNELSILPQLPNNLTHLLCNDNLLTSLPSLPGSLTYLECNTNLLTSLPAMAIAVTHIECTENQLTNLPSLSNSLTYLICRDNQLTSLPALPNSLTSLICDQNQLTSLPSLPGSLQNLNCRSNQLTSLPALPGSLQSIVCYSNQLTGLPTLPNTLQTLDCSNNQITNLPALPNALLWLKSANNQLFTLPTLPASLTTLRVDQNQLTVLPVLPLSLEWLECGFNQLTSLPTLPDSLTNLDCQFNQLTILPTLPSSINYLRCQYNQITSISEVPSQMARFEVNNNNIYCLFNVPQVNTVGNISDNPLSCVPNQTAYSLGLPICNYSPNNCISIVNISGYVFTDQNSNCTYNVGDLGSNNVQIKLYDSLNNLLAQTYTVNGFYGFVVYQTGNYKVKIGNNNLLYNMACAQADSQIVNLVSLNNGVTNINFPIQCNQAYDVMVQSVHWQGWVFPGLVHNLKLNITSNETWFNLDCDTTITTGTVTIQINGPVSYVSPLPGALIPQVNGNIFTYSINNFSNITNNSFGLKLLTDTTAQLEDEICAHVTITPSPIDADTANNHYVFCYNVLNSYDPNMKEVFPVNVLPAYDDWFTYTIHFQNTGNAPAFNISLIDTLDANLALNSFEILGYSHPATTTITGNVLRFNNIMLPDSTTDYGGSMGYFQYRMKPLFNLPNGTQIENTAYIYFDYNAPVVTNTTQNNFDILTGIEIKKTFVDEFIVYPNPGNGVFNFKDTKNLKQVEVYNLLGEQILVQGNQKQINLSAFSKGIYYAKINGEVVVKLVKD